MSTEPLFDSPPPSTITDLRELADSMDADRYPGSDVLRQAADLLSLFCREWTDRDG